MRVCQSALASLTRVRANAAETGLPSADPCSNFRPECDNLGGGDTYGGCGGNAGQYIWRN